MKTNKLSYAALAAASMGLLLTACVVTPVDPDQPNNNTTTGTTTGNTVDHRGDKRTDAPPPRAGGVSVDGSVVVRWRRGRIGSAARFTIEPSMGPVGTVVNIYGEFRPAMGGGALMCTFTGAQPVNPYFVSMRRVVVRVPDDARTGPASCAVGNQTVWSGTFTVVPAEPNTDPLDEQNGVLGAVYAIQPGTTQLPDFSTLGDPIGTFVAPTVHVPAREFTRGFPGIAKSGAAVKEWYALRYIGLVEATRTADYTFKLVSSDGARLYIDDKLVVDNDGVHGVQAKEGTINLSEGKHRIVVEYFKTTGNQISLELWWKRGNNPFSGVAKHSLSRYAVEYDCSAEPVPVMCCKAMIPSCRLCSERQDAAMAAWRQQCRP